MLPYNQHCTSVVQVTQCLMECWEWLGVSWSCRWCCKQVSSGWTVPMQSCCIVTVQAAGNACWLVINAATRAQVTEVCVLQQGMTCSRVCAHATLQQLVRINSKQLTAILSPPGDACAYIVVDPVAAVYSQAGSEQGEPEAAEDV